MENIERDEITALKQEIIPIVKEAVDEVKKELAQVVERKLPGQEANEVDEKDTSYKQFFKTLKTAIETKNSAFEYETKAMAEGDANAGGAFVPTIVNNEIYVALNQAGLVRALTPRTIRINKKTFDWPTHTDSGVVYTIGETSEITDSTISSSKVSFSLNKEASICLYSNELDADSIIPLIPYTNTVMGNKFAQKEDMIALSGTTTYTSGLQINPNILTVSANNANSTSSVLSAASLTADDLLDMQTKLQANNMAFNKNATYVARPEVLGVIKKMKDGQGQYIFQNANFGMPTNANNIKGYPVEGYIFGKPVVVTNQIGDPTTSATGAGRFFGVIYGDFNQLGFVEHEMGFSLAYGTEGTVGTTKLFAQDMSAIRYIERIDVKPLSNNAFVKLVAHA